jgi:predicted esterase YcpF (UPF0227 family)
MSKVVIYCHGYKSSSKSDKLRLLQEAGFEAYCFDADVDPDIAFRNIYEKIDNLLTERMHEDIKLVFIGTSLGGWTASRLARAYGAKAIIINPTLNPKESLAKYGISNDILSKYDEEKVYKKFVYFFGEKDEVIDHSSTIQSCYEQSAKYTIVLDADHRFQRDFFRVIDFLSLDSD